MPLPDVVAREAVAPVHSVPAKPPAGIMRLIEVTCIRTGPYQPRVRVADGELEALAGSVREHGLLQPVVVRPVGTEYELVAGERRWRAACAAGLKAVPAIVRELSDREAAVLSLVENVQREDLHFLEEAAAFRRLIEEFGMTQEAIGVRVGRTNSSVSHKLRLLELSEAVRRKVLDVGLSERHARLLLRLPADESQLAAVQAFAAGPMTVRQAEAWVAGRVGEAGVRRRRAASGQDVVRAAERWAARWRRDGYEATVESGSNDGVEVRIWVSPRAQTPDRGLG